MKFHHESIITLNSIPQSSGFRQLEPPLKAYLRRTIYASEGATRMVVQL